MKRAAEPRQLTDDHHQGMVQARRLRKAATGEDAVPLGEATGDFLVLAERHHQRPLSQGRGGAPAGRGARNKARLTSTKLVARI
jgi:hypothetical protein